MNAHARLGFPFSKTLTPGKVRFAERRVGHMGRHGAHAGGQPIAGQFGQSSHDVWKLVGVVPSLPSDLRSHAHVRAPRRVALVWHGAPQRRGRGR